MEAQSEAPLKVCRHCSVGSRTDAETCPNCGRPYKRQLWRWWFAIPIIAVAFAGGYFGRKAIQDDEPDGLTIEEARALTLGASPESVENVLDGQRPGTVRRSSGGGNELVCRAYGVVDEEGTIWELCFLDGRLEISKPLEPEPG
jgi:hypothetical protein